MRVFHLPQFLEGVLSRESYVRWLQRKAQAHIRRDRERGNTTGSVSEYKRAIHEAVCDSRGRDHYTSEELDWHLISTYSNDESKQGKRIYKAKFALLPTVDHVGDGSGPANFKICGWAINDAKGDLPLLDFVRLCQRVLKINAHLLAELA
ncbi:hypothetical protein LPN04_19345 [Rugamonas sp. A1-17]|nr:hypothetical protein [Rugamonas sp. A1-17]